MLYEIYYRALPIEKSMNRLLVLIRRAYKDLMTTLRRYNIKPFLRDFDYSVLTLSRRGKRIWGEITEAMKQEMEEKLFRLNGLLGRYTSELINYRLISGSRKKYVSSE